MDESWKPITGYEGWYEVSDLGRVRRIKPARGGVCGRILCTVPHPQGYATLRLSKNDTATRYLIHRLVADAFLPNPEGKAYVNHKDGVKTNNAVTNLEWMTASENSLHARVTLGQHKTLTSADVIAIREEYATKKTRQVELAGRYGVSQNQISLIVMGKGWTHIPMATIENTPRPASDGIEQWKIHPYFINYSVSTLGNIKSLKTGSLLAVCNANDGRKYVTLSQGGFSKQIPVHQIIAEVFLGPPNGQLVKYINGDKTDVRLCNLEYVAHLGCISRMTRKDKGSKRT